MKKSYRTVIDLPNWELEFKKECGITYMKVIPQGFIYYLSFTGQQ